MLSLKPETHEYRWSGERVPSVTQIIDPVQDWSRIPKETLARKATLGRAVHLACEFDDLGTLDEGTVHPHVAPYLEAYRRFRAEKRPKIKLIEKQLFHPTFRYAGTLDRVMEVDGYEWVVDLKSCVVHYPPVGLQLAGYAALLDANDMPNPHRQRGALRLAKDGTYDLKRYADPTDWPTFLSLITLKNWIARNG